MLSLQGTSLRSRADAQLARLRRLALALFLRAYPLANSLAEGLTFCYQMLYLVDRSPYYSPVLHLLRQHIVRVSGQELVCPLRLSSPLPQASSRIKADSPLGSGFLCLDTWDFPWQFIMDLCGRLLHLRAGNAQRRCKGSGLRCVSLQMSGDWL